MKSIFRSAILFGTAALASLACAAQPTFTPFRTIDWTNHCCIGNTMAFAEAPNGLGLYVGDFYSDDVFYVSNPLTSDGDTSDYNNTLVVSDGYGVFANYSYTSSGRDGNNIYIGGPDGAATVLDRIVETSTGVFTQEHITGITGIYGGPTVVGSNKVVLPNYATGGLQFFNIAGTVATADGAEIANPSFPAGGISPSVTYDATSGKIFQYIASDNQTRRIDIYNSNGTAAGTTYVGTWATPIPSTLTAAGTSNGQNHNRGVQMSIDNTHRILVVPVRGATEGPAAYGWDVFNISTVTATGTPYKQLRADDIAVTGFTSSTTNRDMTGSAVISSGGTDYLALGLWNKLTLLTIGPGASVNEWSLY